MKRLIIVTARHLILCLFWKLTSSQSRDSLHFDVLLKENFVQEYKELTNQVTINLKTAIENKFSEILTPFSKEFESVDVTKLLDKDSRCMVTCEVKFSTPLDLTKESLVVFHIRSLLVEAGWKILTEQGQFEIQVLFYKVSMKVNEKEEVFPVALNISEKCLIFNTRRACKNGGTCRVEEDIPVCWCPSSYIGSYCEKMYAPTDLNLRLVGGGFSWGFLEMTSSSWKGIVCASDWAESTLHVACRQLGFQGGQRLHMPDASPYASNTILVDNVRCLGNETNLGWCLHSEAQNRVCTRDQQLLVLLCNDVTDVMKFSLILQEKVQKDTKYKKRTDFKELKESLSYKFNSMFRNLQDFSFTEVLSLRGTTLGALQVDFQIMYNHRMGPVRQAMALHNLANVMGDDRGRLILHEHGNLDLAIKNLYLTSTNNNAQFKLNVSMVWSKCELLRVKQSCMNGGRCEVMNNAPYCRCPDGFTGSFCEEDIDECSKKSDCAHRCENIVGGYLCHCNDTFKSFDGGRVCEQMVLPVRLAEGGLGWGRVEVSNMGQWGTVCLHGWDDPDAEVVCKTLGFPGSFATFHAGAIMKRSDRPIWLSKMSCVGPEKTLDECDHSRWSMHDCSHDLDVGLICNHVVDILHFEITLGIPWISEYESSTGSLSMSMRQELQDKFSDLFTEHSSSDGLGSVDVLKFSAGTDGSTIAIVEVTFQYQLDVTSQSLAAFFLLDAVKEAGGTFQMPSMPVTVPIRSISINTKDALGKKVKVVLGDGNRCALFNLKRSCLHGSVCTVEETLPVCKCPDGREGLYCERVPVVAGGFTTAYLNGFYRPLVTEERQVVVNMAVEQPWKANFYDRNHQGTTRLLIGLKASLEKLYRGVKDKLVKISVMELYPADSGSIGFLHKAEFLKRLSAKDQANIANSILREIEDHDNCVLFDHSWVKVTQGPQLRLEGSERDTFIELTINSPCSLHDAKALCSNDGYCMDNKGIAQCFCSPYYTGDFCEIELTGGFKWIDVSVLSSYMVATLLVFIIIVTMLKAMQSFRRYIHRHAVTDFNANITTVKASGRRKSHARNPGWLPNATSNARHYTHLKDSYLFPLVPSRQSPRYYP